METITLEVDYHYGLSVLGPAPSPSTKTPNKRTTECSPAQNSQAVSVVGCGATVPSESCASGDLGFDVDVDVDVNGTLELSMGCDTG